MEIVTRPWGKFKVLHEDERCKVKLILIEPGKRLSLQRHQFRAEHWFVVSGSGSAQIENTEFRLSSNDSVDIAIGQVHRITNDSRETLIIIEVQTGSSFSEDDIERLEDDFGRK